MRSFTKPTQRFCTALLVGLGAVGFGGGLLAADFPKNTPYYEKDAWYDVSEWFDGNDYNPTDETWWRWDDETYQAAKDTGGDRDNDNDGWYGYTTRNDDDYFYDYYDPYVYDYYDYDSNGFYDYGFRYYDYDNDGVYDASASYSDWDGDGLYEDYDYYSFTDTGTEKQRKAAQTQVASDSRQQKVAGTLRQSKLVKVRGGKQHFVVAIEPTGGKKDELRMADLGRVDDLKGIDFELGTPITVTGPLARVGEKGVVLAQAIEYAGKEKKIDRTPREITGTVLGTHKTKVRGKEHMIAMVETTRKDKTHTVAVDLGRADRLKMAVDQGTKLTFSGFPVKVEKKSMILAQTVRDGDKTVQINRQPEKESK